MSFSIKGAKGLDAMVESLQRDIINPGLVKTVAAEAMAIMLERTAMGKDVEGRQFRPYSGRYKRQRAKKGRGTSRVDLNMTGNMLGAMRTGIDVAKMEASVYFREDSPEAEKALYHNEKKGRDARERREFFGLGDKDKARILNLIDEHVKRTLKTG